MAVPMRAPESFPELDDRKSIASPCRLFAISALAAEERVRHCFAYPRVQGDRPPPGGTIAISPAPAPIFERLVPSMTMIASYSELDRRDRTSICDLQRVLSARTSVFQ